MTQSEGGAPQQNSAITRPDVDSTEVSSGNRQSGYGKEFLRQHQRRHEAALRLPPVGPCGCIRDPLFDKHRCVDVLTDHQLDGWVAAIAHLDDRGTPAIVPASVHRALRRRYAA